MSSRDIPGLAGIVLIVVGLIAVSVLVSLVTGTHGHWPFVVLGIAVGLMAVKSINS